MLLKTQCGNAYTFCYYPQPTHWVILAVAGVSGCVLFIHLMTPSKLEKWETLTTVPSVASCMSPPLHGGKVCLLRNCHICMRVFSRLNLLDTSKSGVMTLQSYDQKRWCSEHAVVNSAGSVRAHTDHRCPEPRVLSLFLLVWLSLYPIAL